MITIDGLRVHYREYGTGPAVLLLHGWPTSSHLWRNIAPALSEHHRVIAVDLPGFGASDKPLDVRYGFEFFGGAIDGLLHALGIDRVALVGHDLGGPIAVHWALRHPDRVSSIALLNTLLYPELDPDVIEFVRTLSTPGPREELTSPEGLRRLFRTGLADPDRAPDELLDAVVAPFADAPSRLALARAGIELELSGLAEIAQGLGGLRVPVRVIYGEQDRILLGVGETMARLRKDVAQAEVTGLPHAGHFVPEDAPEELARLLAEFFART